MHIEGGKHFDHNIDVALCTDLSKLTARQRKVEFRELNQTQNRGNVFPNAVDRIRCRGGWSDLAAAAEQRERIKCLPQHTKT